MTTGRDSAEATLGTDPWWAEARSVFDRTEIRERSEQMQEAVRAFEQALDRLTDRGAETARLQEVVRRLQSRVYDLEEELERRRRLCSTAADRIDRVTRELERWKRNEPSPST